GGQGPALDRLDPGQTVTDVAVEARLRLLAVVDDVDAALRLPPDHLGDGAGDALGESSSVICLPALLHFHEVQQIVGAGQAARVRRQDPIRAALHAAPLESSQPGAAAPRLRSQCRFVVQAVDVDAAPDQALLVRGLLEPPEAVAHRREPARVRVVAEEGRLLVGVALEVEVRAAATAHSLVGDPLRLPQRVVQGHGHPGVCPRDALLDEVVVVRLERSRLPEVVADHTLAAVGQEGPHARAGPDAVIVDAEAGIELTTVPPAGRGSLASHPVKPYPAGRVLVQGELDAVAEPAAPHVEPLDVPRLDAL